MTRFYNPCLINKKNTYDHPSNQNNIKTAKYKYFCQFYIIQKKELPLLQTSIK
jgi:hypothetical protein